MIVEKHSCALHAVRRFSVKSITSLFKRHSWGSDNRWKELGTIYILLNSPSSSLSQQRTMSWETPLLHQVAHRRRGFVTGPFHSGWIKLLRISQRRWGQCYGATKVHFKVFDPGALLHQTWVTAERTRWFLSHALRTSSIREAFLLSAFIVFTTKNITQLIL